MTPIIIEGNNKKFTAKKIFMFALTLGLFVFAGIILFGSRNITQIVYIDSDGIHGPQNSRQKIEGDLTIRASDVTLRNTDIAGISTCQQKQ